MAMSTLEEEEEKESANFPPVFRMANSVRAGTFHYHETLGKLNYQDLVTVLIWSTRLYGKSFPGKVVSGHMVCLAPRLHARPVFIGQNPVHCRPYKRTALYCRTVSQYCLVI